MRRLLPLALALLAGLPAACKQNGATPPPMSAMADSADQVMFRARTLLTDQGLLRAELLADTAYFFDENTRIELRTVQTTFFTSTGAKDAVLTSREGTYNTRQNRMEARGNVVVVSQDGRRLESPVLRYDQTKNEISSDTNFTVTETNRRFGGIGFTADPNLNNIRCMRACSGTGGQVTVPAQ
jgi:LPS export ABC transporter protein LptC